MLHTVNKSPSEKNSLDTCFRLAKPGSAILLIEDGVYAAMSGTSAEQKMRDATSRYDVYVLEPDLKLRGLDHDRIVEGIKIVGYDDFVDLAVKHRRVQSWL
ncbi:MAG: sulfurtransferase complex subunit TusB [Gammaproteobacteria bacterium]|nr:sulfurtransferase complex subunit TusB [Gammaproteobacteria bacterium]